MAIDFPRSKYTAAQGASDNTPAWPNPPSSGDTRTNSAGHTFNWNVGQSMWILADDTSHTITNGPTYSWDGEKWIAQSAIPFRYHGALASDPTGLSASDEGDLYFNSTNDDLRVFDGSSWNTVAGNAVNVSTVAGISANVTTVAGISANVTTVANDETDIGTVAGISSDVTSVAGVATEIGRLGTVDAIADMNLLGTSDVVADMALLGTADCVADMALLGTTDVISDMNTLAVSDVLDDMETCANNNANITNVGDDITNVNSVAGDLTNIGTCATNIANINTAATNIADVNNFVARYRFGSTDPTTNNDDGDLFYNTTSDTLKVWDGSSWTTAATSTSGFITTASGGTMGANIDFADSHKVTGLAAPTSDNDAARKKYVDDNFVADTGGTMSGNLAMGTNRITGLGTPTANADAATKSYVDTTVSAVSSDLVNDTTPQLGGNLDVNSKEITSASNGNIVINPNGTGDIELGADVGIHTGSPDASLTVDDSSSNAGVKSLNVKAADNTAEAVHVAQGSNEYLSIDTTNSSELITIGNTTTKPNVVIPGGDVGIGTTAPQSIFHVQGPSGAGNANKARITVSETFNDSATDWGIDFLRTYDTGGDNQAAGFVRCIRNGGASNAGMAFGIGNRTDTSREKMRINSSGDVGIGVTSPQGKLHVDAGAPSSADKIIGQFQSESSRQLYIGWDDSQSSMAIGTNNNHALAFHINGQNAERMRIDTSGRLLVGTATAITTENFRTIQSSATGGAGLVLARSDTAVTAGNKIGAIHFHGNDSNGTFEECATLEVEADGTHGDDDKPTRMMFFTTQNGSDTPTERMRIMNNGKVTLGPNMDPSAFHPLTVRFSDTNTSFQGNGSLGNWGAGARGIMINNTQDGSNAAGAKSLLQFRVNSSDFFIGTRFQGTANQSDLLFIHEDSEKMRLNGHTGCLGIGETNPTTALHIKTAANKQMLKLESPVASPKSLFMVVSDDTSGDCEIRGWRNTASGTHEQTINLDADGPSFLLGGNFGLRHSTPQFALTLAQDGGQHIGWEDSGNTKRASLTCSATSDDLEFYVGSGATQMRMRMEDRDGIILHDTDTALSTPLCVYLTAVGAGNDNAGSRSSAFFRLVDHGTQNNRFHGIDIRNRNSGDVRIMNKDVGVSNKADMQFWVDNGSDLTHSMTLKNNGQWHIDAGYGSIQQGFSVRAWAQCDNNTIRGSAGINAVSRVSTGNYRVTLSFTMPDANYACVVSGTGGNTSGGTLTADTTGFGGNGTNTVSTTQMQFRGVTGSGGTTDMPMWNMIVVR